MLAGIAGLRAGAGKLQIATAASVAVALGVAVPEARVIGCPETAEGCLAAGGDRADLLELAEDAQAVTIGCGLQHGAALDDLLDALLAQRRSTCPLVLDAAVLGCLARGPTALRAWPGGVDPAPPFRARWRGCSNARRRRSRPIRSPPPAAPPSATARSPWSRAATAIIAAPDGRAFRFEGGGVGLATSGSGDVLAGIVGGLAARGADPLTATLWGVWLHGEAGRILTERVGRIGFLAREIADLVPALMEPLSPRSCVPVAARRRSAGRRGRRWSSPASPNGTPAVTMIRSPPLARPWRSAIRFALPTISSKLATSRVRTACAPHSRPSRRAVFSDGVSTSSGTVGRSRATRRAVEPELVKQTIAAAPTVRDDRRSPPGRWRRWWSRRAGSR